MPDRDGDGDADELADGVADEVRFGVGRRVVTAGCG
jgi:hypothetical protein